MRNEGLNKFWFDCIAQELQMISSTLQISTNESYFSCEILEDGCAVDGCCRSHTTMACSAGLQVPVDTAHWKLQISDMHSLRKQHLALFISLCNLK